MALPPRGAGFFSPEHPAANSTPEATHLALARVNGLRAEDEAPVARGGVSFSSLRTLLVVVAPRRHLLAGRRELALRVTEVLPRAGHLVGMGNGECRRVENMERHLYEGCVNIS